MARPERTLDPDDGPLQGFAWDLRELRRAAGGPAYRTMSEQVFRSSTSLSEAAGGRRLPSLDVTLAYVRACGGDEAAWSRRWEHLAAELGGGAEVAPVSPGNDDPELAPVAPGNDDAEVAPVSPGNDDAEAAPVAPGSDGGEAGPGSEAPAPGTGRRRWMRTPWTPVVAGVAVVMIVVLGGVAWSWGGPGGGASVAPRRDAVAQTGITPVDDGDDPRITGCSTDATTLETVDVVFPGNRLIGRLELRHSPRCGAAWGRFSPTPALEVLEGYPRLTITVSRPRDGLVRPFSVVYDGQAAFGDLVRTGPGCVRADLTVTPQSTRPRTQGETVGLPSPQPVSARTGCRA